MIIHEKENPARAIHRALKEENYEEKKINKLSFIVNGMKNIGKLKIIGESLFNFLLLKAYLANHIFQFILFDIIPYFRITQKQK